VNSATPKNGSYRRCCNKPTETCVQLPLMLIRITFFSERFVAPLIRPVESSSSSEGDLKRVPLQSSSFFSGALGRSSFTRFSRLSIQIQRGIRDTGSGAWMIVKNCQSSKFGFQGLKLVLPRQPHLVVDVQPLCSPRDSTLGQF